jgi:hypothetical protein
MGFATGAIGFPRAGTRPRLLFDRELRHCGVRFAATTTDRQRRRPAAYLETGFTRSRKVNSGAGLAGDPARHKRSGARPAQCQRTGRYLKRQKARHNQTQHYDRCRPPHNTIYEAMHQWFNEICGRRN